MLHFVVVTFPSARQRDQSVKSAGSSRPLLISATPHFLRRASPEPDNEGVLVPAPVAGGRCCDAVNDND